jgi:hypothetical protein
VSFFFFYSSLMEEKKKKARENTRIKGKERKSRGREGGRVNAAQTTNSNSLHPFFSSLGGVISLPLCSSFFFVSSSFFFWLWWLSLFVFFACVESWGKKGKEKGGGRQKKKKKRDSGEGNERGRGSGSSSITEGATATQQQRQREKNRNNKCTTVARGPANDAIRALKKEQCERRGGGQGKRWVEYKHIIKRKKRAKRRRLFARSSGVSGERTTACYIAGCAAYPCWPRVGSFVM